jgi:hypothetical protein
LDAVGIDTTFLWVRIYDVIIKAVISAEPCVVEACRALGVSHSHCFELLGFDILIDSALKYLFDLCNML